MRYRIEATGAEAGYFDVCDEYGGVLEAQAQDLEEQAKKLRAEADHLTRGAAIKRARFAWLRARGFLLLAQTRGTPTPPPEARLYREGDQGEVLVIEWETTDPAPEPRLKTEQLTRIPDLT